MESDDFINGHARWCLWLLDASPKELRKLPLVMERVKAVREFRLASVKAATREFADQPTRFMEIKQPNSDYLMIPVTSFRKPALYSDWILKQGYCGQQRSIFCPECDSLPFWPINLKHSYGMDACCMWLIGNALPLFRKHRLQQLPLACAD